MSHSVRSDSAASYRWGIALQDHLPSGTGSDPQPDATTEGQGYEADRDRGLFAALIGVVALPFVVAAIVVLTRDWTPAGDQSVQILRLEQVGTRRTPLLGAWSRWGWNHPGPWPAYLLAPFTWVFGAVGALVGTLTLNASSLVLAVIAGRRRGGLPAAAFVALAGLLMGFAQGPTFLMDLWNPFVGLFPLYALVVVAWSIAERDWRLLPFMVALASFCLQAHIGYLPVVAAVCGTGLLLAVPPRHAALDADTPPDGSRPAWKGPLLASAGVVVVAWLPTLIEQVRSGTGNLTLLARYSVDAPEPPVGWRTAWRAFSTELGLPGAWVTGAPFDIFVPHPSPVGALVVIATVAVLGALAHRAGARSAGRLAVLGVTAALAAFVATSRITGFPFDYLLVWWWAVGAAIWLSIGWSAWSLLVRAAPRVAGWTTVVVLVATAAVAVGLTVRSVGTELPVSRESAAVRSLIDQIEPALIEDDSYIVEWRDSSGFGYVGMGVYVDLARRGQDVIVPIGAGEAFDDDEQGDDADHRLVVSTLDDFRDVPPPLDSMLIARHDPLTSAERAEADALWSSIVEQAGPIAESKSMVASTRSTDALIDAGVDQEALERFRELRGRGRAFVAYLLPGPANDV
jgi:hypothetical protein